MVEIRTQETDASVKEFLDSVPKNRKEDGFALLEMFSKITGEEPKMWGSSIVGFGKYHYKSDRSRQEGDWMLTGFSPRKQSLSLYLMLGFEKNTDLLAKLGKHKTGMGCLYINKLADVDIKALKELITKCFNDMRTRHASDLIT